MIRQTILLICLMVAGPSTWAATYYVRTDGHDATCNGLTDAAAGGSAPSCAFRTIQKGVDAAAAPGDTVLIHAGTYYEAVSARVSGSADSVTTIMGAPGETVVIDTGVGAFRTPGNSDWELVNPALGEYRSVGQYAGTRVFAYVAGIEGYENGRVLLVPYVDTRDEPAGGLSGFSMFRATTDVYTDPATPFYVGPGIWPGKECSGGDGAGAACEVSADCAGGGICVPTSRIHIRLAKTADLRTAESRYGPVFSDEDADPRDYSILLSLAENTLRVFGSYLRFENLTFNHSRHTIAVEAGAHHVAFDDVTVWAGTRGIVADAPGAPAHHITITRSRIFGDVPYWIFWSDAKHPPFPAEVVRSTLINMREGAHDWEISWNHIRGGFDALSTNDHEDNISVHHNRIENAMDDAFEVEGEVDIGRIAMFENYIGNCHRAFSPGQDSPNVTGPILFYRNVVALLRELPFNRAPELDNANGGARYGYVTVFKQHAPHTFYYHNTVILIDSHRRGIDIVPGNPGEQADTYVFNNVLVKVNGLVQGPYMTGPGQIVDHDLYWKMNSLDGEPLVDMFDTVPALAVATGLETHGLGAAPKGGTNPRFRAFAPAFDTSDPARWTLGAGQEVWSSGDFLLDAVSPALGAGRPLPTHPVFGAMPDSRPVGADLGALPSTAAAEDWDIFPFNQGWRGPLGGPDLVVESLGSPPGRARRGAQFGVGESVRNRGTEQAGSSVTGYVLSPDRYRDPADTPLVEVSTVPDLDPGSGSTATVSLTIPSAIAPGAYFLIACADSTSVVPEPRETDNCRTSSGQVTVTAADLVVDLADPPPAAVSGDAFAITDTVVNQGTGSTGVPVPRYRTMSGSYWSGGTSTTGYYLSLDGLKDGADLLLEGTRQIPVLTAGASSSGTTTVTIPVRTPTGSYTLLACADHAYQVYETVESNNCRASAGRVQVTVRDLMETAVTNLPATVAAGASFSVTDTVRNQGSAPCGAFTTRFYLSPDATQDPSDMLLGERAVSGLAAGETSTGTFSATIPATMGAGSRYLIACADDPGSIVEFDEANNCLASAGQVQIQVKDLVETALTEPPATVVAGNSFSVTDTVRNQGQVSAGSSTTRYYLSPDTIKSATDTLLTGTRSVSGLSPGATSSGTVTVTVPVTAPGGLQFLLACADDREVVVEGDETNNCRASSGGVQVLVRDLVTTAVSSPPPIAEVDDDFPITDTIRNQGTLSAGSSTSRYYLSLDTIKDAADILLVGTRSISSLAAGASNTGTDTSTIPAATPEGLYYLLACADDKEDVVEGDETNNCLAASGRVQVTAPDLVEVGVADPPAIATQGSVMTVMETARNQGSAPAGSSTTRYYVSVDTIRDANDTKLSGTRSVPSLAPGAESPGTDTVTVPTTLAAGLYYLLACADDVAAVLESNEANNCTASAGRVQITAPDLVETAVTNPPVTAMPGGTSQVTDTAANLGQAPSGTSSTRYYLSLDLLRNTGDVRMTGTRSVPALAPGAVSTGTITVTVPTSMTAGLYYLLACADDTGSLTESDEANNCLASVNRVQVGGP